MNLNKYLYFVLLIVITSRVFGQNNLKTAQKLVEDGFENVKVFSQIKHLYVSYENNRYRFEAVALSKVLELIELDDQTTNLTILIQNKGIGITAIRLEKLDLESFKSGMLSIQDLVESMTFTLSVDALNRQFEDIEVFNPSYLKVDISAGVTLDYFLGDFTNSIRQKVNVQPEFNTTLGQGIQLTARYNMPYFNEIDDDNFNNMNLVALSNDFRLRNNQFLNISMGYFTQQQFGFHSTYNRFLYEERLKLSVEMGLTRRGYLDEKFKPNTSYLVINNTLMGGLTYRWIKYNTDIALKYGTFYKQDLGYQVSYTRQMGERYIGLFMKKTTFGDLVGFNFRVPIGERKHLKPNRFRVRSKEFFELEYNYSGKDVAESYSTGQNILSQMSEYYPSVLKSGLIATHKN